MRTLWIALLLLAVAPARAGDPTLYERTVSYIDRLFLYPDTIDAEQLVAAAARGLADDLDWLMVEVDGETVTLSHGDGSALGSVVATTLSAVPQNLDQLERMVRDSGYDLGDVDVSLSLLSGMTDALDRYSRVLAGDGLERFDTRLKGTLVGVGFTLTINSDDALLVKKLNLGGPAERAGVRVGDVLLRIDERSTVNMPVREAVRRVKGARNTVVSLHLRRGEQLLTVPISREEIVVPNVLLEELEGGIGYLRITHISQRTVSNLVAKLAQLEADGYLQRGLVLDLRGNTGGSMKESARAADQFVKQGLLLRTEGPDGGKVHNLQSEMSALDSGAEPQVPIVVLMDKRTASGSEIIAGTLLELGRAALVGTHSYGKGTVQKIYTLAPNARLKLTVAQYVLAHDRYVAGHGLDPDVFVGEVVLDGYGVRYHGWDLDHSRVAWRDVVPQVSERSGWRGESHAKLDLPRELARRALLEVKGPERVEILRALRRVAVAVRREQLTHLTSALGSHGVNWSAATEAAGPLQASVSVSAHPDPDEERVIVVEALVHNPEERPLSRALVELESGFSAWDGLVIPIGRVPAGGQAKGQVRVPLRPGVNLREDAVQLRLRADRRPSRVVGEATLQASSAPAPRVRVRAKLLRGPDETHVHVEVDNLARAATGAVEVHFGYPGDLDLELLDRAARTSDIAGHGSGDFDLAVQLGPRAPAELPLDLVVRSEAYGQLAHLVLPLPLDGSEVVVQAPVVRAPKRSLTAPTGPFTLPIEVRDERGLDHVVVYLNGDKLLWAGGDTARLSLAPTGELLPGANRFVVLATDDQGIKTRAQFVVRAEAGVSVDADGTP